MGLKSVNDHAKWYAYLLSLVSSCHEKEHTLTEQGAEEGFGAELRQELSALYIRQAIEAGRFKSARSRLIRHFRSLRTHQQREFIKKVGSDRWKVYEVTPGVLSALEATLVSSSRSKTRLVAYRPARRTGINTLSTLATPQKRDSS